MNFILGGINAGRSSTANIHANRIALEFARLYGTEYVEFFAPAIFSDRNIMQGFMKEKLMQRILQYYKEIKNVITGIGIPDRGGSTMVKAGYITEQELNHMVQQGVVGYHLLQFYKRDGRVEPYQSSNERVRACHCPRCGKLKTKLALAAA